MVNKIFDKNFASVSGIKNETIPNRELAEELQKSIIRKFETRKVHLSFIEKIWSANLADMQLISKVNKGICFLLCVIDIFSKYAWIIFLKDKTYIAITNASQKILDESGRKPNKIWVDKGCKFYNRSMKLWLQDNDIEMYSTFNEGKSVVAERFIRNLTEPLSPAQPLFPYVHEAFVSGLPIKPKYQNI